MGGKRKFGVPRGGGDDDEQFQNSNPEILSIPQIPAIPKFGKFDNSKKSSNSKIQIQKFYQFPKFQQFQNSESSRKSRIWNFRCPLSVVRSLAVLGVRFDHKFPQHSALSSSLNTFAPTLASSGTWTRRLSTFNFSEHFLLPLISLLNGLYINLSLLIRTQQHYPTRSFAMQHNPAEPAQCQRQLNTCTTHRQPRLSP